jgi:hypothetical protein
MRWPRALLIGTALLAPLSGCRSCDQVERALRGREIELRETKEELERQQAINHALQLEVDALHAPSGVPGVETDKPAAAYPVRSLVLGNQTGGVEDGGTCGDQALQVIVQPKDADNSVIKVPGSLIVQAIEVTPQGLKRPLSTWEVTPDQLSRTWRDGLLSKGYALTFPWKIWPSTEKLRVVVQMRLQDGRLFEADRDVTVHLPPPSQRRVLPPEPPADPPKEEPLPKPRPAEGPSLDTSAKPKFNAVQPAPVAIPNWNDPWHAAAPSAPAVQMLRPVARDY